MASRRAAAALKDEFSVRHLQLRYEYYEYFVQSQCLPTWLLWILRLAMGGFCLGVFLYLSITSPFMSFGGGNETDISNSSTESSDTQPLKQHFYLCYLTIWSYLVITLYFLVTLYNMVSLKFQLGRVYALNSSGFKSAEQLMETQETLSHVAALDLRRSSCGSCSHAMLKLQWLLYGVAANAAVIVTVGYFGVIYRYVQQYNPGGVRAVDLFVHGLNSVFMFLEVLCSGVPVHLLHALFTAAYGALYGIFSFVYWLPDHSNVIYPVLLDWNNAGRTLGIVGGILLLGLPAIQLFWWLVYLLRCLVASVLVSRTEWRANSGLGV